MPVSNVSEEDTEGVDLIYLRARAPVRRKLLDSENPPTQFELIRKKGPDVSLQQIINPSWFLNFKYKKDVPQILKHK